MTRFLVAALQRRPRGEANAGHGPRGGRGVRGARRAGHPVAPALALRTVLALALAGGGCAARPGARAAPRPGAPAADEAAAARQRVLLGADSGLWIRQWQVADDAARIEEAMMRHADGEAAEPDVLGRLARNGLYLVRVPVDRIDALRADLGGTAVDIQGWHGQCLEWTELAGRALGPETLALAVDGRTRPFASGRFRLMIRGWTVAMEDGAYVYVEMRPEHDRSRWSRLDQVLGRKPFEGERFSAMEVDLMLEEGFAYVLTCQTPGHGRAADEGAAAEEPAGAGPGPIGPEVAPPLTVGEMLFRTGAKPPSRGVLLLVPRIPVPLHPAGEEARAEGE